MEAIFTPIFAIATAIASPVTVAPSFAIRTPFLADRTLSLAVLAASLAICVAMVEKFIRRWNIVISGFALIVSRRAIVVSHHEMTLDVISGMIGALGGVAPDASAPTAMVGRVAEEATHGASIAGNGKMYAAVCKKPAKRNVVCVENTTFVNGNQIT